MWPDQVKRRFREWFREWFGEAVGTVVVQVGAMDTPIDTCQRFEDVIAIRKALAKRNMALLEDAISEVDLAVWELLCADPTVSDRDLYWRAVTRLRRCRRHRTRQLQREVLGSCWDHLADGWDRLIACAGVDDVVVTRIELEATLDSLRPDLHQLVARQAGWSTRAASTSTQRLALQRWRAKHQPEGLVA